MGLEVQFAWLVHRWDGEGARAAEANGEKSCLRGEDSAPERDWDRVMSLGEGSIGDDLNVPEPNVMGNTF